MFTNRWPWNIPFLSTDSNSYSTSRYKAFCLVNWRARLEYFWCSGKLGSLGRHLIPARRNIPKQLLWSNLTLKREPFNTRSTTPDNFFSSLRYEKAYLAFAAWPCWEKSLNFGRFWLGLPWRPLLAFIAASYATLYSSRCLLKPSSPLGG